LAAFVIIFIALGLVLALFLVRGMVRKARRQKLMKKPFPEEWNRFLDKNVALYRHLPASLKDQLHGDIQIFLDEKNFEGCGGLEITDEIRVTITAQACILLLNRKNKDFPKCSSVLVYPSAYVAEQATSLGGQVVQQKSVRAGESWARGSVVLAWDHVKRQSMDFSDRHNVVLHEFAHQLDQEGGPSDGAPILEQRSAYITWARVMGREYQQLQEDVEHHRKSVLDAYGATNPAEFFAVATETFFKKPGQLKKKEPELYEELMGYYKLDPAGWVATASPEEK